MEITRDSQLSDIDAGLKRIGITQHRLEILSKVPVGTIKDLRRGKRAMEAGKWQRICAILNQGLSKGNLYTVDKELMSRSFLAITSGAAEMGLTLREEEKIAFAVALYNHVMKYRERGKAAEPDEATAELILQKAG